MSLGHPDFDRRAGKVLRDYRPEPPAGGWERLSGQLPPKPTPTGGAGSLLRWAGSALVLVLLGLAAFSVFNEEQFGTTTGALPVAITPPVAADHDRRVSRTSLANAAADAKTDPPRSTNERTSGRTPARRASVAQPGTDQASRPSEPSRTDVAEGMLQPIAPRLNTSVVALQDRAGQQAGLPPSAQQAAPLSPQTTDPRGGETPGAAVDLSAREESPAGRGPQEPPWTAELLALESNGLNLFPTRPQPLSVQVPNEAAGNPQVWSWALRVDVLAHHRGGGEDFRALLAPGAPSSESLFSPSASPELPLAVQILADPAWSLRPSLEVVHREGVTLGLRTAIGSRRLDLSISRQRLLSASLSLTAGYRHSVGRWTPYGYAILGYRRQEHLSLLLLDEARILGTSSATFSTEDELSVLLDALSPTGREAMDLSSETLRLTETGWRSTSGLGAKVGADYRLSERLEVGVSAERLFEQWGFGLGARLGL